MTLPVSSYEALLVQVRELTHETIQLQRQLSSDLCDNASSTDINQNLAHFRKDYQGGKLLYDDAIQRRDVKIEAGRRTLVVDRNESPFHPCLTAVGFDRVRESFSAGELTARLVAWKRQVCQSSFETEEETSQIRQDLPPTSTPTGIPSIVRVSVESGGASSPNSRLSSVTLPPEREAPIAVRPYYAAGDPPLSPDQLTATELRQSAFASRILPPCENTASPRLTDSKENHHERCRSVRSNRRVPYPRRARDADMEANDGNSEDVPNSDTPSPEPYTGSGECYDDDGSSDEDGKGNDGSRSRGSSSLFRGTWPVERDLWASRHATVAASRSGSSADQRNDTASVMSFSSSTGASGGSGGGGTRVHRPRLGAKVDVVYSLLGMLGSGESREDMSATLLAMSESIDNCLVMRQSGCLPLLVQLIHAPGQDQETRERAATALRNVVHARSDEKVGRREARVLRLLEQVRDYCQAVRASLESGGSSDDFERHPGPTIAALMKLSFDEAHRHAMCQLGGLRAVSELVEVDHASHGGESEDQSCVTLRRYAGMALTNLTFGDGNNKALLCSFRAFMKALVYQLRSTSDDLRQVTASVLRNLSWRADSGSKRTLREVGAVTGLTRAAMEGRKESTLKSILSALWNLSAHCSTNKVDICAVEGALAFLVDTLSYRAPSKTLSIVENAGGILRNVSSHIAVREDYRKIVRERGCLQVLLRQLRSPSLTVVSNACGALWNLSARCPHDQRLLWDLGAVPMLRSLVHSKHKMISMGSSAALKNLLSARPAGSNLVHLDSTARGLGLPTLPSLVARRQRALEQEIDQNLAETCDNIEPSTSPTNKEAKFSFKLDRGSTTDVAARNNGQRTCVPRSDSRESMRSVTSTHSDTIFERVNRRASNALLSADSRIKQQSFSLHSAIGFNVPSTGLSETHERFNYAENKYALRYKNSSAERSGFTETDPAGETTDPRFTSSTVSWATGPDHESVCSQIYAHSSIEDALSPASSSGKSSIRRSNSRFTDASSDEWGPRCTRVNFKSPSVESPRTNVTLAAATSPTLLRRPSAARRFDAYAETDLDQPTDYSLRYAERNSDQEDECQPEYFERGNLRDLEDTTPETRRTLSDASSDTRLLDTRGGNVSVSRNIDVSKVDEVARAPRDDGNARRTSTLLESQTTEENFSTNCSDVPISSTPPLQPPTPPPPPPSSEYLTSSDRSVVEGSRTVPLRFESLNSGFDGNSESSVDTTLRRLDSPVVNDEPKISNDSIHDEFDLRKIQSRKNSPEVESISVPAMNEGEDYDDDDEDLLAACIHIGMRNNNSNHKHRQSFRRNSLEKSPPSESNLARYRTSTALDQVEGNGYVNRTERSSQSDSSRFNIKPTTPSDHKLHSDSESLANGYAASFQDNFNVENNQDKITVEYRKLREYSCDRGQEEEEEEEDRTDGNVGGREERSAESITRQTRANSVEDNVAEEDEAVNDDPVARSDSGSNREIHDSESMESFDSVERSEQALLQLCIKPGASKVDAVRNGDSSLMEKSAKATEEEEAEENRENLSSRETATRGDQRRGTEIREKGDKSNEDEYRRRRDPDAMIASLDRLTATLVQQTEAMRERESSAMKQSVISDTWTEDSPNDVSYPSISVSAPLMASFKSDVDEEDEENARSSLPPPPAQPKHLNNCESSSMTNSRIIEREAIRMAEAVDAEVMRQRTEAVAAEVAGVGERSGPTSMDFETVGPASMIDSSSLLVSHGLSDDSDRRRSSNSLSPIRSDSRNRRKKSLPIGVMAKRALGHDGASSLDSLLYDCSLTGNSQLENVMPPSLMDELLDNGDMENSMISVASITSEIADSSKDHDSNSPTASDPIFDLVQPVAHVLSITCMRYAAAMNASASDSTSEYLENINPPSLLNEVSDMDDSTIEANTETVCSDTLCIDAELRTEAEMVLPTTMVQLMDEQLGNDTDEAVSSGGTPIATESCCSSSAESTPKKRSYRSRPTPKQRRQLAKERFKTYTIAAELVKKEQDEKRKRGERNDDQLSNGLEDERSPVTKLTPKQRRLQDRTRFQTRVLTDSLPDMIDQIRDKIEASRLENPEGAEPESAGTRDSLIPTALTNLCGGRTFTRKRGGDTAARINGDLMSMTTMLNGVDDANVADSEADEIARQAMLEQNANIVLHTLDETSRVAADTIGDDSLLDCETLSLVSNESESENTARMRRSTGGSLGKRLVVNYARRASQLAGNRDREESVVIEDNEDRASDEKLKTRAVESPPCVSDSESDEDSSRNADSSPGHRPKRPKIVKPGCSPGRDPSADSRSAEKSEPSSPKGVRGRRKALYSNPSNTRKPTPPPPRTSPFKGTSNPTGTAVVLVTGIPLGRSNVSPPVRATRATTLRQNTNVYVAAGAASKDSTKSTGHQKIAGQSSRNFALSKRSSIPQRGSSLASAKSVKRHSTPPSCPTNGRKETGTEAPPIKPLERQGTFTKDEPEVENAPTVSVPCSPTRSKIAKPARSWPVRSSNAANAGKAKTFINTHRTGSNCDKIQLPSSCRVAQSSPLLAGKKNALLDPNNASVLATNEIGKTTTRLLRTTLGQRSNSNSSIVSSSSPSTPVATGAAARKLPKEATSKIAGLWKKVEESKNRQKLEKPDTRRWIPAAAPLVDTTDGRDSSDPSRETSATVANKRPAVRLFRSSTFEGIPVQESKDTTNLCAAAVAHPPLPRPIKMPEIRTDFSKYRNSCDLTGMTPADAPCKIPIKLSERKTSAREIPNGHGTTIVLRKQRSVDSNAVTESDPTKRVSRLGSFIRVETSEAETRRRLDGPGEKNLPLPVSSIVSPLDADSRRQALPASTPAETTFTEDSDIYEFETDTMPTGSARVTTV